MKRLFVVTGLILLATVLLLVGCNKNSSESTPQAKTGDLEAQVLYGP
jgi:hypothetical protein